VTLGLRGFGGTSVCLQSLECWRHKVTPDDLRASVFALRGLGGCFDGHRNYFLSQSISSSSPKCVRLVTESVHSSDHVGETFGIPFANLADIPSVLHPEGLRFLGVLLGWFVHCLNHSFSDLRIQEIKISTNREIWIFKRILFELRRNSGWT